MVRSCHLDTCPVGIATQRPELRAKYRSDAGAGRGLPPLRRRRRAALARLARAPLLRGGSRPHRPPAPARRRAIRVRTRSTSRRCSGRPPAVIEAESMPVAGGGELGRRLATDARTRAGRSRAGRALVRDLARGTASVGARLGGLIGERFGSQSPPGRIRARFHGLCRPELRRVPGRRGRARPGRRGERLRRQGDGRRTDRDPAAGRRRRRSGARRQHRALRRDRRGALLRRARRRAVRRPQLGRDRGGGGDRRPRLRVHDRRNGRRPRHDRPELRCRDERRRGLRLRPAGRAAASAERRPGRPRARCRAIPSSAAWSSATRATPARRWPRRCWPAGTAPSRSSGVSGRGPTSLPSRTSTKEPGAGRRRNPRRRPRVSPGRRSDSVRRRAILASWLVGS